jgi:glycosyltransferase involved in cell wall biosynthesis
MDEVAGVSALLGGAAVVVPNGFLAARLLQPSRDQSAKAMMRSAWLGEIGKVLLTALLFERHTMRRADELISISPYVTEHYGRSVKGRVHEIPNAIGPSFFDAKRAPEEGRLLFAGRIIKRKGVLDLVRAVARSRGAVSRLVLAGSAPERDYEDLVRREVEQSGLTSCVEFAGLLDESALLDEFGRAEALVLPSYQETAPMVVQQAMAAGLPVIASSICGVPYQIQHDVTGLLFPAGAIDQLATLLTRLRNDPLLGRRLGESARVVAADRYPAVTVARATHSTYKAVLARP